MLLRAYGPAEHPMPEKSVTYVPSTSVTHVGAMNTKRRIWLFMERQILRFAQDDNSWADWIAF
jgi:hypothetical protein